MAEVRVADIGSDGNPVAIEILVDGVWQRKELVPDKLTEKSCGNCGKTWPAEYGGQCDGCGAPMSVAGPKPTLEPGGDVNAHLAAVRRSTSVSGTFATRMEQSHGRASQGDTGHPAVSHVAKGAAGYAQDVLEEIFG